MSNEHIRNTPLKMYKKYVEQKVKDAAPLKKLEALKKGHSKVEKNNYENMNKPQEYLTNNQFSNTHCAILFAKGVISLE